MATINELRTEMNKQAHNLHQYEWQIKNSVDAFYNDASNLLSDITRDVTTTRGDKPSQERCLEMAKNVNECIDRIRAIKEIDTEIHVRVSLISDIRNRMIKERDDERKKMIEDFYNYENEIIEKFDIESFNIGTMSEADIFYHSFYSTLSNLRCIYTHLNDGLSLLIAAMRNCGMDMERREIMDTRWLDEYIMWY